ncbi:MAG: hypothetical protein ACRC2S_13030 [Waterburya sp.]
MPRKAYLEKHYRSEELKQKYLKSQDPVESRVMASTLENISRLVN